MPLLVWTKYSSEATWCTLSGRSELYKSTTDEIDVVACQKLCVESNPECSAFEFWEAYNYACFQCTDLTKVQPYTNEADLAYPVYVWVLADIYCLPSVYAQLEKSSGLLLKLNSCELKRKQTKILPRLSSFSPFPAYDPSLLIELCRPF